ncbi:uncharacterized protein [Parasteatoda tepidariorum]|uniref:uncharacterized protein n=1 Tax=Parasteatoda tepidariorum TaxID=114398 RepID=UPI0039BD1F28
MANSQVTDNFQYPARSARSQRRVTQNFQRVDYNISLTETPSRSKNSHRKDNKTIQCPDTNTSPSVIVDLTSVYEHTSPVTNDCIISDTPTSTNKNTSIMSQTKTDIERLLHIIEKNINYSNHKKIFLPQEPRSACINAIQQIRKITSEQETHDLINSRNFQTSLDKKIDYMRIKLDDFSLNVHSSNPLNQIEENLKTINARLEKLENTTSINVDVPRVIIPPKPIIVKPQEDCSTTDIVERLIQEEPKLPVKKVYRSSKMLELKFHNNQHKETVLSTLQKTGIQYHDKDVKLFSLILLNTPVTFTETEIINLIKINGNFNPAYDIIKLTKEIPHKRDNSKRHIIIRVNRKLSIKLLNLNYFYAGLQRCTIKKRLVLLRCRKCQTIGHHQNTCIESYCYCEKCGYKGHSIENCTEKEEFCINCHSSNQDSNLNLDCNHRASSPSCPTYLHDLKELRQSNQEIGRAHV